LGDPDILQVYAQIRMNMQHTSDFVTSVPARSELRDLRFETNPTDVRNCQARIR